MNEWSFKLLSPSTLRWQRNSWRCAIQFVDRLRESCGVPVLVWIPSLAHTRESRTVSSTSFIHWASTWLSARGWDLGSAYPLISYEKGSTGRRHIGEAFSTAGLEARFVLQATDAEVIETYVRMGIGVGMWPLIRLHKHFLMRFLKINIRNYLFTFEGTATRVRAYQHPLDPS
jgi:hypothetical protein